MRFDENRSVQFYPIGFVRSPFREKMAAPRQGSLVAKVRSQIELFEDPRLEHALDGIELWSHVWVLFYFDRDPHFSPKVKPPRGTERRGVLATRSPHRPNPIGLSAARLVERSGRVLVLEGLDLLDETPVIDIKPYVTYADSIAEANDGWLEPNGAGRAWKVVCSERVETEFAFLATQGVSLKDSVLRVFESGPEAHPSRRIRRDGDNGRLSIKDFRVNFRVFDGTIELLSIVSGYEPTQLETFDTEPLALHRRFVERFGDTATSLSRDDSIRPHERP